MGQPSRSSDAPAGTIALLAAALRSINLRVAACDARLFLVDLFASTRSPCYLLLNWLMVSAVWWHAVGVGAVLVLGSLAREAARVEPSPVGCLTVRAVGAAVAAANVGAFWSFRSQWRGLVGSRGLAPARVGFPAPPFPWPRGAPPSDAALRGVVDTGLAAAVLAFLAAFSAPRAAPVLLACCGVSYLALIRVAGDFLALPADANVVEADALVALATLAGVYGRAPLAVLRFSAARKALGRGVGKWHGDRAWRDLAALPAHDLDRPPVDGSAPPFSRGLPGPVRRFAALAALLAEIAGPLLALLGSRRMRLGAWAALLARRAATPSAGGAPGFFGVLDFAEALALLDDGVLAPVAFLFPPAPPLPAPPVPLRVGLAGLLAGYVAISLLPLERAARGDVLVDDLIGAEWGRELCGIQPLVLGYPKNSLPPSNRTRFPRFLRTGRSSAPRSSPTTGEKSPQTVVPEHSR